MTAPVTRHPGSALPRLKWQAHPNGLQATSGDGWTAVVRPRDGGGYEAEFTSTDRLELYPQPDVSDRTPERCKAWVRLRAHAAADRNRWVAYLGQPSPKLPRQQSFVDGGRPQSRKASGKPPATSRSL